MYGPKKDIYPQDSKKLNTVLVINIIDPITKRRNPWHFSYHLG
jgi:hypothetical protein